MVTLTYWPGEGGEPKRKITQLAQGYWKAIGVNVDVREVELVSISNLRLPMTTTWLSGMQTASPTRFGWSIPKSSLPASATPPMLLLGRNGSKRRVPKVNSYELIKAAIGVWNAAKQTADEKSLTDACLYENKAHVENLWSIGTIGLFPQPVIINAKLSICRKKA